jgi:uncharacterized protein YggE
VARATGQGSISVTADEVRISVSVSTQATTAQDAAAQNATLSTAVQAAVQKALGNTGTIATVGYSITPNYRYPTGGAAQLVGYTVTNTVVATSSNVGLAGPIIDVASQAGATTIGSLQFGLKDDAIPRAQALTAAAQQARSHALAMVSGLNARLGNVVALTEGSVSSVVLTDRLGATASTTPITPGPLTVQATVTADFEILP